MVIQTLSSILLLSATVTLLVNGATVDKENEVKLILENMETDVLNFRNELERVYSSRCETSTLKQCYKSNYNDCSSIYPNQECMKSEEMIFSVCGDGDTCNGLWDTSQTAVRIPYTLAQAQGNNPHDADVIESICYSRLAEEYMIDRYGEMNGNQLYFGSATGSFRIIPARHSETCGEYDPRKRPWYVAASSGPKDVVLVIDTSGSMADYGRMVLAKDAAVTIIKTLTVADRVAIIAFSDVATQVGGYTGLIRATSANKKELIAAIDNLEAASATNFYDAFSTAFDALDQTIMNESTSGCNIAILFMTDGQITVGGGHSEVIDLVNLRTDQLAQNFNRKTTIFTFSLGVQADHATTKSIACNTGGIWSPVDDFTDDLVRAMGSYYKLYALGLGEGGNEDFTAWVEPYMFHTSGKMGTSVSTPVYDKSVTPPLFLGVVAVDMYMDDLEEILGEDSSSSNMLDRFVLLSTARCPKIELSEVELDALRFLGGGEEATCGMSNSTNTEYTGIVPEECGFDSDLPNDLWHNTEIPLLSWGTRVNFKVLGKDITARACCEPGSFVASDSCATAIKANPTGAEGSSGSSSVGMIVGIVVAVVAILLVVGVLYWRKKNVHSDTTMSRMNSASSAIDGNVTIMTPPSAPPLNPAFNRK